MVLSEWPLGIDLAEADDLAARAAKAGVRTAIGLQARYSPAVIHARRLVAEGYIGKVLASSLTGSGMAWGDTTDSAHAYMFDASRGATTLTVPMLHALDAAHYVLGEFVEVAAASAIRRPTVRIADTAADVPVTAADHIAVVGALESGAILSAFYRGATTRAGNFRWEINGTEGDLLLTSDNGNMQVADLSLSGGRGNDAGVGPIERTPDATEKPGSDAVGIGANVLREYAALVRDIRDGTHEVPDFAFAVNCHRLITAIEQAAATGRAQRIS